MSERVQVKVKIFGAPSLALESRELTIKLSENATAEDLLNSVPVQDKNYVYIVRDGIRLNRSSKINDGDQILILPPIAGG